MTKTAKIQLYYKDDEILEYKKAMEQLWQLQKETRAAANRAIQMCWEYNGFESDWKKSNGEYPTKDESRAILGKSLQTVIYDRAKQDAPSLNTGNLGATLQAVIGKFNSEKRNILRGDVSIPSYKSNMPIDLNKKSICLDFEKDNNGEVVEWIFRLSLFSNNKKKELGLKTGGLAFKGVVPGRSKRYLSPILERCCDGTYSICGSKLKYDNGKWFIFLCFSFEKDKEGVSKVNKDNVMGVHIGEHNAVTCTFNNSKRKYIIDGGEILAFAAQVENRRRSIGMASKKNSKQCSEGRIGHGYHAKMKPLENISSKVTNFRNTVNHRYSRQIVDWAVQNNCGTIQIEDLTGYASQNLEKYKLLKNWSYYDLQTKIESKAKEHNIDVIKVSYAQLKKWCPNCGMTSIEGTETENGEEKFICKKCGQIFDLDYIVESAVAVTDIDKLLKDNSK